MSGRIQYSEGVKISEKLVRLIEGRKKSEVAERAHITPSQLNDYAAYGKSPRYDFAIRLARALGVAVEWLLDDEKDWPPVRSVELLSDEDLMLEVARRYREVMLWLHTALERAKQIDWGKIDVDRDGEDLAKIAFPICQWADLILLYHPESVSFALHEKLPGSAYSKRELSAVRLNDEAAKLYASPVFREAMQRLGPWWPRGGRNFGEPLLWPSSAQRKQIMEMLQQAASNPVRKPSKPPSKPQ